MSEVNWKEKAERLEAELEEKKKNIKALLAFGDIMQRALWPHDELEVPMNPGTHIAPPVVKFWREYVAEHLPRMKP
jgi:hypothetical protein